jgi:hypothetical protein
MSLGLEVDLETLADVPNPVLEAYAPSNGEVVFTLLIPYATADALDVVPDIVTVSVVDPLEDHIAYHVLK